VSARPVAIYAGYLMRCPLAGYVFQTVHYLRALRDAGIDVWFWEDTRHTWHAFDPIRRESGDAYENGVRLAGEALALAGFADRWVFHDAGRDRWSGAGREAARELLAEASILINAGGVHRFTDAERVGKTCVYIDMDPAYTQLRVAGGDRALADLLAEHAVHFTFGENIGTDRSPIPSVGIEWRATRQPVALDLWPATPIDAAAPFTTIGTWESPERDVSFRGERYSWSKRDEWRAIADLPSATGEPFTVAMEVRGAGDRAELGAAGWQVVDPIAVSADPSAYQAFVRGSRGEFTTAKDVNVRLRSGWFSDRSACYLAMGRPVITQDTGFGDVLPVGEGLLAYRTLADAVAAVEAVRAEPERHARGARAVAERCFAAPRVAEGLLAPL
jgi:hypothetical protein